MPQDSPESPTASAPIRWGLVVLGAFLLELALVVVLTPIALLLGAPVGSNAGGASQTPPVVFAAIAAGCLIFSFLFGIWIATRISSRFALHGALVGIGATVLYLAISSIPPGSISATITAYGPFLFCLNNVLRIGGAAAGAVYQRRKKMRPVRDAASVEI